MNGCERHLDDLALLVADEIDPERREAIERHLAACPGCGQERAAMEQAFRDLRDAEVPDPGPVYWSGFEARLRTRLAARRAAGRRRVFYAAAAAALVVALGLGVVLGRRSGGGLSETAGAPAPGAAVAGGTDPGGAESAAAGAEGERAEARLEAALRAAGTRHAGAEEFEAILDEIAPGDPYDFAGDALGEPDWNHSGV